MIADYRRRLWVSVLLTVPIVILSPMVQEIIGVRWTFQGDTWIQLALSTTVFAFGGWPFLQGSLGELRKGAPGMMTLIAVAITSAYLYSTAVVFGLAGMLFYWELATLIDIMLLGHIIEMRSVMATSNALDLLVRLMPDEAHLVHGDHVMDVKLATLKPNDLILIKPGEKIPADGMVVGGESHVNESLLTGESLPVRRSANDRVIGGSVNGNGSLTVRVEHTGEASYLHQVADLVREAQKAKSETQNLADRAARSLTYVALGAGLLTLIVWLLKDAGLPFALERMVTVMVISCPHALGLAVPLVVAYSTMLAARNGLLIRDRTAFENARKITTIVFDKTGTLTTGEFGVRRIVVLDHDFHQTTLLRYAGAVEQHSEHPIASGIMRKLKDDGLTIQPATDFKADPGHGVQGTVQGRKVMAISPKQAEALGFSIPEGTFTDATETVVFIVVDDRLAGAIALADPIRTSAPYAIERFHALGIKTYMATGDNERVAAYVSEKLGLDGHYSQVLPHEKVEIIKRLQDRGGYVAMAGDGVNDAPALAQADVGIAIGSGTDVAAATADIILVRSDPNDILQLVVFGRATYRKMVQNLWWAAGYNVVAIPLAAGVLHAQGIMIGPAMGAALMSMSTVIVALNARLLKRNLANG